MGIRGSVLISVCTLAAACSSGGDGGGGSGSGAPAGSGTIIAGSAATGAVGGAAGVTTAGTAAVPAGGSAGVPVGGSAGVGATGGAGGTAGSAGSAGGGGTGGAAGGGTGGTAGSQGGTGGGDMGGSGGTGGSAVSPEVQMCIQMATDMGRTGACPECGCTNCLDELMNCQDEPCATLVNCGQDNGCVGTDCYCGDAAALDCLSAPTGACKNEIVEASGLLGMLGCATVDSCGLALAGLMDENNPVARAAAVSLCVTGQDAVEGMPAGCVAGSTCTVDPVEEVLGACETECTPTM